MGPETLAKFLGLFMFIVGFSFIINKKRMKEILKAVEEQSGIQFLTGFITVLIGSLLIANYNAWAWNLTLSVTLAGWLILLSGLFRMCCTQQWVRMMKKQTNNSLFIMNLITIALGIFFLYLGYCYPHY